MYNFVTDADVRVIPYDTYAGNDAMACHRPSGRQPASFFVAVPIQSPKSYIITSQQCTQTFGDREKERKKSVKKKPT